MNTQQAYKIDIPLYIKILIGILLLFMMQQALAGICGEREVKLTVSIASNSTNK